MSLRLFIFVGLVCFFKTAIFSQDYFSYGGGNYSGLNQVIANPAAAADNRLKIDIILAGLDVNFNNSWFGIKRSALSYTGSITKPKSIKFPTTWKNATPNVPDNVFKNFTIIESSKGRAAILENRVLMPSFMYQINQKNSIAFTWSLRQITNINGLSKQLANLFEKELDFSVTQNNRIQNKNFAAVQMSWAEYGLTFARVIKDKNEHFLKAGITPKLLQGFESGYLIVKDLDFLFSTKDTNSYFNTQFEYAHSANFSSPFGSKTPVRDFYQYVSKPSMGLDIGFIYEWRPNYIKYKYKADRKNLSWRKDLNKYKVKIGASVTDIGRIKFKKEGTYYNINANIRRDNFTKFTTVGNFTMFDSLLRADFSDGNQSNEYSILLPTAINLQADLAFNQLFYINLSSHLANFYKNNFYKVHNYSAICLAPRVEHYWFDLSVPFTYNVLSAKRSENIMTGLNVRLGPLCFGSNDVIPLFKGDVKSFNFFAILKIAVPYKRVKDRDGDGVKDSKDECVDDAGDASLRGCPDADYDKIVDKVDECPNQPGLIAFKGCPDTDGDGVIDKEDQCPYDRGSAVLKGCPDTDKDGIIDKEDACPSIKGIAKYKGCVNTDDDALNDDLDDCPTLAGSIENHGCPWPDTDNDGIIDKQDSCVTTRGLAAFKGCPEAVQLAMVEQRIVQKAFSNLEFESGKDVIKPSSFASLNALVKLLITHKDRWQIKLSGHTDNEGTEEGNLILSEKRAKAIRSYLVKKALPFENIIVEWFGQSQNIADNSLKEGRRKNRRVEMMLLIKPE